MNIWWRSTFCRLLGSHMDSYYMRRALQSLTDAQKARLLTRPYVMTSPAEQRHGGASQAEAADQGRRREQRCPEQQRSEGDDCDPQRGGTQPPRGYVPAQYTSSASWAEAKSDSNMDEHHSAKRPRSENIPSQAEPGMISTVILPQPSAVASVQLTCSATPEVHACFSHMRGEAVYDGCKAYRNPRHGLSLLR